MSGPAWGAGCCLAYYIEQCTSGLRVKLGGRKTQLVQTGYTIFYSKDDAEKAIHALGSKYEGLWIVDTVG